VRRDGSCSREFEVSWIPGLAVGRIIEDEKGIRLCKEDFIMRCSYSETVMNPLPGYD
jgi:hypothetical protein